MPLFRKRGGGEQDEHQSFEEVVDRAMRAIGRDFDRREDHLDIKLEHGWQGYDLSPLRARCDARPKDTWLGVVTKQLRETVELAEREGPPPPWDEARTMLKLRLHRADAVPPAHPLGIALSDDLFAALAIDRGDSANLLRVPDANAWGQPFDELIAVARDNTANEPDLKLERIEIKDGGGAAAICSSTRWFAATQIMWPERLLGEVGRHGAVVAAPNPHVSLAHPIEDRRTLAAVEQLRPWADRRVAAAPNPISPYLFWWRPGSIVRLDDERLEELEKLLGPAAPPTLSRTSATGGATVRMQRPR